MLWAKNDNIPFPSPHKLGVSKGRRVILISLMEPPVILFLALIELTIIGNLVKFLHLCVQRGKEILQFKRVQRNWVGIDQRIRIPHRFRLVLWVIYGVGFNCIIRSFLYSVLQIVGVLQLRIPLGFTEEYIITCICSFSGSFLATVFYKSEGSSHAVPYSVALAISILPTGLLKLIIDNMQTSVGDWILWPVSIVALSLIASLVVFKFVTFLNNMLERCRLDEYIPLFIPPSAYYAEENEHPEVASSEHPEGGSSDEQPTCTLQDLTEQGASAKDTAQDATPEDDQNQRSTKSDGDNLKFPDPRPTVKRISIFFVMYLAVSWGIELNVYSYHGSGEYLNILILDTTQLTVLFFCGSCCPILCRLVGPFPKNYAWSVIFTCIPFYVGYFIRDVIAMYGFKHDDSMTNTEFFCVEVLRVPFELAAVGFLFVYVYLFVFLNDAKNMLSSIKPNVLDSFGEEQTQTV